MMYRQPVRQFVTVGAALLTLRGAQTSLGAQSQLPALATGTASTSSVSALSTAEIFALAPPPITMASTGKSTRPITAAEAAEQAAFLRGGVYAKVPTRSGRYPADSLHRAANEAVAAWLARVPLALARGMQLDPAGYVRIAAAQDIAAQAQIAARLATPGLSLADKASTLRRAVETFCDQRVPGRLPIAEAYLRSLDSLGTAAVPWQFEARRALMWIYYALGRSADVTRHGQTAIALLSRIPYGERWIELNSGWVYTMAIEAVSGRPNARSQIDSLTAAYRAAAVMPTGLVTIDTSYVDLANGYRWYSELSIKINAKLGMPGAPLIAHTWLNRASPGSVQDSAIVPLNDGKIRVLVMGNTDCAPCVQAIYGLQHLHDQFPQIEPVFVTFTYGSWASRLVDRTEEVAHLTDYFLKEAKVTYPVAIWAGKRIPNEDDGADVEPSPNFVNYPVIGKPMVWIIDGHGIVRKVIPGYSREVALQIAHTAEFLSNEASAQATDAPTTPAASVPQTSVR